MDELGGGSERRGEDGGRWVEGGGARQRREIVQPRQNTCNSHVFARVGVRGSDTYGNEGRGCVSRGVAIIIECIH